MDIADDLAEQVRQAAASAVPLSIRGGGSKAWLGRESAVITLKELSSPPAGEGGRRDRLPQDAATKLPSPLAGDGQGERGRRDFERISETLNIAPHNGIVDYDPRELVLTARA